MRSPGRARWRSGAALDRRLRAADHLRRPRPDGRAGLGLLRRPGLALRPRQRAHRRPAHRHAGERHRPRALRRRQRAGGRERAGQSGRSCRRARPSCSRRALPADPAPARPARHRRRHGQPGARRRAGRGARRGARAAADRRGRARAAVELAHRPGEPADLRRDLCRADLHARGRGLRPFSVVHVEQPWRRRAAPAT
jgi:hypothetical protein